MQDQLLIYFFFHILIFYCRAEPVFELSINEETPANQTIVNLKNFVKDTFNVQTDNLDIELEDKYFFISSYTYLTTKKVMDVDKLCDTDNECCVTDMPCFWEISAYVNNEHSGKEKFKVKIEIRDINDNRPFFDMPNQTVSITENENLKTIINIIGANDRDVNTTNRIQRYKFSEMTNTFSLDSTDHTNLKLVLQKPIDYEKKRIYNAYLNACEGVNNCPAQSSITIQIEDQNDNNPKFIKPRYSIRINEDHRVDSVIMAVKAIDIDGGKFNKTKYTLDNQGNRQVSNLFKVDRENGNIILKKKLSASQGTEYRFKVIAMDDAKSSTSEVKDVADVYIIVNDINDHKPKIELTKNSRIVDKGSIFKITIKENEPSQKLMTLKVTDEDLGENKKVTCELKEQSSILESRSTNLEFYEIWNLVSFDYERDDSIRTIFECKDGGSPPQVEYKTIEIIIEDVNEFPPTFQKSEYLCHLNENTPPGIHVIQVIAIDKDKSASLIYSISEDAMKHFSINITTGEVKTASEPFDREVIDKMEFIVSVRDDIKDPKTASVMVKVIITDMNDNDPVFSYNNLKFYILENQEPRAKLSGILNATDDDRTSENSLVKYDYVSLYDHNLMKVERTIFQVKAMTGEIVTLDKIDREVNPNFTLTVKAYDNGIPSRFAYTNVTIYINDLNDNAPEWIYPRSNDVRRYHELNSHIPTINISENCEKMRLILKLQALDKDAGEAGRVSYSHKESGEIMMFTLNGTTGELFTIMSPLKIGPIELTFTATDHGKPPRISDAIIRINVQDSGRLTNINLTIIIGMITITAFISLFLIVAIICVKRRPAFHKYSASSTELPIDNSNQFYSHNPYIDITGLSMPENENFVFLPPTYCSSPHTDPLSITCPRPSSRIDLNPRMASPNNYDSLDTISGTHAAQNMERLNGTLRSNGGFYGTGIPTSMGMVINGQELDGDSADSGKGASEVDLRLQHQFHVGNRNYPTMPFLHYPSSTTSFGQFNNVGTNQYYSINTNPRSHESRFLTINPATHLQTNRRVASPSNSNCPCFMLPEDDIIHISQENEYPMNTFLNKSKLINHDRNCIYNGDEITPLPSGSHYYPEYPCGEQGNLKEFVVMEPNDMSVDRDAEKSFINLTDNKNLYIPTDQKPYSLALPT